MLNATLRPSLMARTLPSRRTVHVRALLQDKLPVDVTPVVGERIGKWLGTPFDLLAFPARAGAGALVSFPERIQSWQSDAQKLVELVQDPRPVEEKGEVLRKEIEATMLEFLEKGAVVEQDVLSNLKTVLPADAANALTELIPDPPNKQAAPAVEYDPTAAPTVTYGQEDVISVQIEEPTASSPSRA